MQFTLNKKDKMDYEYPPCGYMNITDWNLANSFTGFIIVLNQVPNNYDRYICIVKSRDALSLNVFLSENILGKLNYTSGPHGSR